MKTVTGLYDSYQDATAAVFRLEHLGVPRDEISIVANNEQNWYQPPAYTSASAETGAEAGAGLGAVAGGASGLLAGLGLLSIPGIGPVVAAGWLVATAAGAAAGAVLGGATGGLIGALTGSGVPHEHASFYVEGVRRGGTLVTARVEDAMADEAQAALREGSVDMETRRRIYDVEGWGPQEAPPRHDYSAIPEQRRRASP